ncbi:MAG: replicative DNA helicase [Opitutales bacterium]|nr:replicative DNA helicase [Opitutales bacterium]MCH8539308.1 replicative DNA helicase [Opitutales bacterium]
MAVQGQDKPPAAKGDFREGEKSSSLNLQGKVPPHSLEAEEGLLACCILDGAQVLGRCVENGIRPEAFYHPFHQIVFTALLTLYGKKGHIDEILLGEELQQMGEFEKIGGFPFLNNLTNRVETPAFAEQYIAIVREKYLLRSLIRTSTKTIDGCFSFQGELAEFLGQVESEIFQISEQGVVDRSQHIKESVRDAYALIQKILERKGEMDGIPSGFKDLDKLTNGFHPSEMIVLAARPSMGKTSLAMNMAESAILPRPRREDRPPIPTLIFSLEMSSEQLAMRMLCGLARVSMIRLRDGISSAEEKQQLLSAADELSKAPLWIDDTGHMNILELRAKARRHKMQNDIGMVIIDYLQLINGLNSAAGREQQISEISRGIKAMAKEINVPVIVLSQLNRESEKERRQPRLSDLRESGSIEQDADVVLLLARPKDAGDEHAVAANEADLIIAKQRNGPVGDCRLTFIREITRFENHIPQS